MGFARLARFLAQSDFYRRVDGMVAFVTYREVRELGRQRAETPRV